MRLNPQIRLSRKKADAIVGLDIEAGSIAATEVHVNGVASVRASAIAPLAPGAFHEGEVLEPDRLASALKELFSRHKLDKRVRLGVGNQRVIVRTVRLPALEDPKEMDAAVRFQAQDQIPMPLDQAVLEHQVVGGVPAEEGVTPQVDVLVVAARRDMVSSFLRPIRQAGLHPVGVDLSAFGMIRALASEATVGEVGEPGQRPAEAVLYCNVGDAMNLAVARGTSCIFTRVSHVGLESIAGEFGARLGLIPEHAMQWLVHVGLQRPLAEVEGDPEVVAAARQALEMGATALVDELRLSLDYYGAQEAALPVAKIVLCGPGSAIAGLPEQMGERLGMQIEAPRPAALSNMDPIAAARLTLPFGLALER
jgi:type IV pilus assembly protein PilM